MREGVTERAIIPTIMEQLQLKDTPSAEIRSVCTYEKRKEH